MSLRVLSTPLRGRPLTVAALLESTPEGWYVVRPHGGEAWRKRAQTITSALVSRDWLPPLIEALQPSGRAEERLRAAAKGGFVVTAGQQPALFGGPLYTWWKALSAVALADALEKETGLSVAPVYWAATDDADYVEAASTVVVTSEGAQRIQLDDRNDPGLPMAQVPLGDVQHQLQWLRDCCGSAPHPEILELVEMAYVPSETVGSSFVKLLRSVLEPLGVSVLDAAHEAVREQGRPLMQRALERAPAVEAALLERDSDLKAAGYASQVQTVRGRTLVFSSSAGRRARVSISRAEQVGADGNERDLSPNVLLRPILERSILPTVAYLGGPAEIAYFAQTDAVARALDVEPPLILPRWSGVVVEPRVHKTLEKYSLSIAEFSDPHAVETRVAKESLPESVRSEIAELRDALDQQIGKLYDADEKKIVSPGVIEGLRRNFLHRVERLERRYTAAIKRRGNDALEEIGAARASLYPLGVPQERALSVIPFMARYGDDLFTSVMREVVPHVASLV